jgi:aminoglycoside 3-N-acetyltransferase
MSEQEAVRQTETPATVATLARDLGDLGVVSGMTLLVHSSLSALGWVCGGPVAVVQALLKVLGDSGTLVMPSFSGGYSEPSHWVAPPVPEEWWATIRAEAPAYDPAVTPTRKMGVVVEGFRRWPGTLRSAHPQASFVARGPRATQIVADHALHSILGEESPLTRLYELDAHVLLLGVGYERNSSLHLAEYRADFPTKREVDYGAPVLRDGQREWVTWRDILQDEEDFARIGAAFTEQRVGRVALADARFFSQRAVVDFAVAWMEENR